MYTARSPLSILALAAALAVPIAVHADGPDLAAEDYVMFGINRDSGMLWRYDFADQALREIGLVHDIGGNALSGIEASTHHVLFQQLHAFWTDPSDSMTKMVRVDTQSALASLDVINLGTGKVTGAAGHVITTPAAEDGLPDVKTFHIYVLQDTAGAGDAVSGGININPNNSPQAEFTCTTGGGVTYTRDDLHKNSPMNGNGIFYEGAASYVRVKPKGNGNQNSLVINGQAYSVDNGKTYEIINATNMVVRIQNDKPKNGKAMGHWWIDITAEAAEIHVNGALDVTAVATPVSDLLRIDTQTREVVSVKKLSRVYHSLATLDGQTFYAVDGDDIFRIVPASNTEAFMRDLGDNSHLALEFAGEHLMVFENSGDKLKPVSTSDGQVTGWPNNMGMFDLGTITFIRGDLLPDEDYGLYD